MENNNTSKQHIHWRCQRYNCRGRHKRQPVVSRHAPHRHQYIAEHVVRFTSVNCGKQQIAYSTDTLSSSCAPRYSTHGNTAMGSQRTTNTFEGRYANWEFVAVCVPIWLCVYSGCLCEFHAQKCKRTKNDEEQNRQAPIVTIMCVYSFVWMDWVGTIQACGTIFFFFFVRRSCCRCFIILSVVMIIFFFTADVMRGYMGARLAIRAHFFPLACEQNEWKAEFGSIRAVH